MQVCINNKETLPHIDKLDDNYKQNILQFIVNVLSMLFKIIVNTESDIGYLSVLSLIPIPIKQASNLTKWIVKAIRSMLRLLSHWIQSLKRNRQDDCQYVHDEVSYISWWLHTLSRAVIHGRAPWSFLLLIQF